MKVEAYACPVCENVFKTEEKAKSCEEKCKKAKEDEKKEATRQSQLEELVNYVRLNAESVEDICKMSEEVSKKLFKKYWIKSLKLNVRYNPHASNSHSAPIGKGTNWGGKSDKPTGYPALTGTIIVTYNKEPSGFSSDSFNRHDGISGINTGSGGYRSDKDGYTCEYGVTLWLSDFPKIENKVSQLLSSVAELNLFRKDLYEKYCEDVNNDSKLQKMRKEKEALQSQIHNLQNMISDIDKNTRDYEYKAYGEAKENALKEKVESLAKPEFGINYSYYGD